MDDIDAKLEKVQLEPGDILVVNISELSTPVSQVQQLKEFLEDQIRRKLGIKNVVVVALVGKADFSVVKRNELSDIYQRLDTLEKEERLVERVEKLESEVLYGGT